MLRKFGKSSSGSTSVPLSIIGPDVRIVGDIYTEGEMQVDGRIEGDIACKTLVIGPGAHIAGEVKAATIQIHGEVAGRLSADHVTVGRTGRVTGDICHGSLEIHAGAQVEGHFLRKDAAAEAHPALPKPDDQVASPAEKGSNAAAAAADEAAKPAKAKTNKAAEPIQAVEAAEAMAADDAVPHSVN